MAAVNETMSAAFEQLQQQLSSAMSRLKSLGATADRPYVGCIAAEAHRQISTHICKSQHTFADLCRDRSVAKVTSENGQLRGPPVFK